MGKACICTKKLIPDFVALEPGIKQRTPGMRRFGHCPAQKFFQQGRQVGLASFGQRREHHATCGSEQLPPKLANSLQVVRTKGFDLEARTPQSVGSGPHGEARLSGHGRPAVIFEITDPSLLELFES